jgi:hypothetical protein
VSENNDENRPESAEELDTTSVRRHSKLETVLSTFERNHAFILALVIIIPFIYLTASVIESKSYDMFKDLSAVWGIWVGAVIGYFFGSKQVEV